MTRLVCNFPDWVIGTHSQPANASCTPSMERGVGDARQRRALGQRPLLRTKVALLLFNFPPPALRTKGRKSRISSAPTCSWQPGLLAEAICESIVFVWD